MLSHLLDIHLPDLASINEEVIVIANELTPSDTALLDKQFVKGFSTEAGGPTSHSAIIARSLDIPALVGTKGVVHKVSHGDLIIIDSHKEVIMRNPSKSELAAYQEKYKSMIQQKKKMLNRKHKIIVTKDKKVITIGGNISSPTEVANVLACGATAIGLYRTEFLYMGRQSLPTEDEQYRTYKSVLRKMGNRSVIIRTVDIGGDKELNSYQLHKETNPVLGSRGIRFSLDNEALFRTQLRALLRASVHGNLKIIFPMIATIEEFKQAKAILLDVKENLKKEGISTNDDIEVGMMIEVPSAALIAKQFAKVADFFSIGTNDLIQYTMAVDRMNEKVAHLYQPYHPAILQLIHQVVQAAHEEGKKVSVCGEMAGDPFALAALICLDIDSFSMSAPSIVKTRAQLSNISINELALLKEDILSLGTEKEVIHFIREKLLNNGKI